ncbi:hypothetical protein [Miniphocaeibacter massiliensis]|uniref:hypothetical protein n=1 Tax=Miniphocaeibacter massiliensis TaxID=2041841 RepID=UPI000C1C1E7C|nr:hypothetical protein [Miniphocaeibacter massiliensis]
MKFKNPNARKIKGSHLLLISCAYCKEPTLKYQKVGNSGLIKMYNDRILEGNIDFSKYHGVLLCPNCGEQVAIRYITKNDRKEAYRLHHSTFNKKKIRD